MSNTTLNTNILHQANYSCEFDLIDIQTVTTQYLVMTYIDTIIKMIRCSMIANYTIIKDKMT